MEVSIVHQLPYLTTVLCWMGFFLSNCIVWDGSHLITSMWTINVFVMWVVWFFKEVLSGSVTVLFSAEIQWGASVTAASLKSRGLREIFADFIEISLEIEIPCSVFLGRRVIWSGTQKEGLNAIYLRTWVSQLSCLVYVDRTFNKLAYMTVFHMYLNFVKYTFHSLG